MDFNTTIWATIRAAGDGRRTAIGDLVGQYREAVVRFARARGLDEASAEDVAQEVFLRLFHDEVLERANAARGRFRSLILAVTRHVLGHHFARQGALKRGGGLRARALTEAAGDIAVAQGRDADFDREWLSALIASALRTLERENPDYARSLLAAADGGRSHRDIAAAMGKTEAMVRNYISRGKAKLAQLLRQEIAAYASSPEEFTEELRYLSGFIGPARAT